MHCCKVQSLWQVNEGLFDTHGGLTIDHSGRVENREHYPIHPEVGGETQSNGLHSGSQIKYPLPNTPKLNDLPWEAHTENHWDGRWEHIPDPLENPVYYSELDHALSQLPEMKEDLWLDLLSADNFAEFPHKDGFHSEMPYNSIERLRDHSEMHNTYQHDPLSFFNPDIRFSQSSSGHQIHAEHQIKSLDNNLAPILQQNNRLDTSFESQTVNHKPLPTSDDASLQPSAFISPFENKRRPLKTLEDSFTHVDHVTPQTPQPILPISEANQGSKRSSYS